jgi:hypothetical protein
MRRAKLAADRLTRPIVPPSLATSLYRQPAREADLEPGSDCQTAVGGDGVPEASGDAHRPRLARLAHRNRR